MATSAEEPQPWDMESPIRSLGFQTSQVKVPPDATMWAQPGVEVSVSVCTMASGRPATASPRSSSSPWFGPDVDAQAGHVGTDRGQVRRRHHAVGERQCVGLLRRVTARRTVGVDAVHIRAVGAAQHTVDRRRQLGRPGLPGPDRRPGRRPRRPAAPPG